ncbi:MAG: hypothetical protein ACFCVH_05590 [Alphaproteobacteria bacterium]
MMQRLVHVTVGSVGVAAMLALSGCGGDPPRVPFPTAGTTPSATTPTLSGGIAGTASATYLCTTGAPLSVTVAPGGGSLSYAYAGYPAQQMTQIGAGGTTFSNGTYQLLLQGNQAQLSHANGGQPFDSCTRA